MLYKGWANYDSLTKSSFPSGFVNNVLLKHIYIHSFIHSFIAFCCFCTTLVELTGKKRPCIMQRPKYWLSGLFLKKFTSPWSILIWKLHFDMICVISNGVPKLSQLIRVECAHLFSSICSVMSCGQLEISPGLSLYTIETIKCYESDFVFNICKCLLFTFSNKNFICLFNFY